MKPVVKQKQFLRSWMIQPEHPCGSMELLEIDAVFFKTVQRIAWRELRSNSDWRLG